MATQRKFKLKAEEIQEILPHSMGCVATNKITVDGLPVGYMYRERPVNDIDTGWRFFAGTESQEYLDNSENSCIYKVNTIANYDKAIIPYLDLPAGIALERIEGSNKFRIVEDQ